MAGARRAGGADGRHRASRPARFRSWHLPRHLRPGQAVIAVVDAASLASTDPG